MPDILRIDAGVKVLQINDGPDTLKLNLSDVGFFERFTKLKGDLDAKVADYQKREAELDAEKGVDDKGLPLNISERAAYMHEACTYIRSQIDVLFGDGTSQKLFGDALSFEMIGQFFSGITPYIEKEKAKRISKYAPAAAATEVRGTRKKHKVMK
jgi:hypothetical protein